MTAAEDIRRAYDTIAVEYADMFRTELDRRPLERALLAAFAELVGDRPVADLGCGPGRLTAHLRDLGVSASGIDLSPEMIAIARRDHPDVRFEVGSVLALDLPDGGLGGLLAWYSLIHLPPEQLGRAFAEFRRVLAPGGHLLVAFKAGDQHGRPPWAEKRGLALQTWWSPPDRIAAMLDDAGFRPRARLEREADVDETQPQAFLLVHKPA